jgi:hypothetical protein
MMFADRILNGIKPTLEDPETASFNGNIAVHRQEGKDGLIKFNKLMQNYDRKFWMTETSGHDTTWQGALNWPMTFRTILYMVISVPGYIGRYPEIRAVVEILVVTR